MDRGYLQQRPIPPRLVLATVLQNPDEQWSWREVSHQLDKVWFPGAEAIP